MNLLDGYGMDTITLAGTLEAKLAAVRQRGMRPTGFQVLRDFEGLSGHLHSYKLDIAKAMREMCAATGSKVLLARRPRATPRKTSMPWMPTTARTFRAFPGECVHSEKLADLVLRLDRFGYLGDYSFEVFNDDYQQLSLETVAERARRSAIWLHQDVLHKSVPLPQWASQRA